MILKSKRNVFKYSTRGLTAWPEAVPGTGLRAGVGGARGAAAARPGLQLLHPVPQGALLHITVITKNNSRPSLSHFQLLLQLPKKGQIYIWILGQFYKNEYFTHDDSQYFKGFLAVQRRK